MLACLILANGCLAYRSGNLPPDGGLPAILEPPSRSISVLVRVERTVNGEAREFPPYLRESWIQATLNAYRNSGLFSEVRRGSSGQTDLRAEIRVVDTVQASQAFGYLSAMSWLLLPSRTRDQLKIKTVYRTSAGKLLGGFRSEAEVTTWFQILLLPAAPFASRNAVVVRTIRDLSLATADRARRKGILEVAPDDVTEELQSLIIRRSKDAQGKVRAAALNSRRKTRWGRLR